MKSGLNGARSVLWQLVEPLLRSFGERITVTHPSVRWSVGWTSSDAFLIRGHVVFCREAGGDEVAVIADALIDGDRIVVSVDACMDNGEIIDEGPTENVFLSEIVSEIEHPLDYWIGRLEMFLSTVEKVVAERVSTLS